MFIILSYNVKYTNLFYFKISTNQVLSTDSVLKFITIASLNQSLHRVSNKTVACEQAGNSMKALEPRVSLLMQFEHSLGLGGESLLDVHYLHYALLTARSLSTLVTPQCNPHNV